jgi:hypothetical protein
MRGREETLGHALHCMADWLSLLHARQGGFCMRGREETLASLQLSKARHAGQLCRRGADWGTGRREAWALGLLVPREQDIAAEQEHVETGGRR